MREFITGSDLVLATELKYSNCYEKPSQSGEPWFLVCLLCMWRVGVCVCMHGGDFSSVVTASALYITHHNNSSPTHSPTAMIHLFSQLVRRSVPSIEERSAKRQSK